MIQWGGSRYHPGPVDLLQPLLLIAFGVVSGVLLVGLLDRAVPRVRRSWRARRRARRDLRAAATAEERARAVMSELCPHGWRADITVFEHPDGEGDSFTALIGPRPDRVRLYWTELRDAAGTPAISRELWAPTVACAMEAMVADRRTDETLEAIEQGAVWDGASWPEPEDPSF